MTARISKKYINMDAVLERILPLSQLNAVIDGLLDLEATHVSGFEHLMQQLDKLEKYYPPLGN